MPELPEVELVTKSLEILIKGRKIIAAELIRERLAPENSPTDFAKFLEADTRQWERVIREARIQRIE